MHRHTFVMVDVLHRRYRCDCGVLGRRYGTRVVAMLCQKELKDRKHCAKDAVFADGIHTHNRCVEHAQAKEQAA